MQLPTYRIKHGFADLDLSLKDNIFFSVFQTRFHTYRVVLAEHNMNEEEGPEQSIRVEKMIIHPKWNNNCVSCG